MGAPSNRPAGGAGYVPRLIAWEVTRSCMLACKHCRAGAQATPYAGELSTDECFKLLDNIASFAKPILILTGGEPMLRPDIYDIAARATALGLRVVMAPCGALVDDESAAKIVRSGIQHISISLDGATEESHDAFRGVSGAYAGSLGGIEAAKRAGLDFQINTTITQHNLTELPAILDLSVRLGATMFNPFLLVPTGRGKDLADQEISPEQYEQTLEWLAEQQTRSDIGIRVTCAPHYQRIVRRMGLPTSPHAAKGCMGGQGFAFISHRGKVQICGFLDVECGDVRKEDFDFHKIWDTSEVFLQIRDLKSYHGRCGRCEFARVCGGCRARAFALTGDYLDEEPFCTYQPKRPGAKGGDEAGESPAALDPLDRKLLSVVQTDFPVSRRPFDTLAERLSVEPARALARVASMRERGVIRRLGAVFDSRSLGYASTLVAGRIPPDRLAAVAETVSALAGVTHNYRREHAYNLWFTLTAESEGQLEAVLAKLKQQTGIEQFHSLPALVVYKIRVHFHMDTQSALSADAPTPGVSSRRDGPVGLSEEQKDLVRLLQEDLPLGPEPFDEAARRLGWPADRVLSQIRDWLADGVIRRFGAVVQHRQLGFTSNGMAALSVPLERIDDVGRRLADRQEISHCYRRPPLEDFPYNLYAMVHGRGEQRVRELVAELAGQCDIQDYRVLFSTEEYKKTSMKYFMETPD